MALTDLGPVRLSPEDAAYEAPLREALVAELYSRSRGTIVALVPVLFILKAILGPAWSLAPGVKAVFIWIALVLAARLALVLRLRLAPGSVDPRRQAQLFLLGAVLLSGGFAGVSWLAWNQLSVAQVGLLVVLHAGINAVAMTSMAPSLWSYLAYSWLDIFTLLTLTLLRGGFPGHEAMLALLLGLYLMALTLISVQNHRSLVDRILSGLKLRDLSLQDTLTGLRNRRFLVEFMEPETEQVLRSWDPGSHQPQSFAILLLDLDHFKQVNDTYGHAAGDAVLKQLAALLGSTLRKQDLVIRWGGEEFVLVARGTDRGYALMLAERIREKVAAHTFRLPGGGELHKTCSIGYSVFPFAPAAPRLLSWEQVLSLADACLYRAKGAGRDRAIGAFPGERPWEGDASARLEAITQQLDVATQAGEIRLVGELR
ncbi:MAG: GGDEF domain-containing protein [Acidobacteria bacterium]|nr:GGDEF domain-containing protein [Acidobacteriota bacterium]